MQPKRIVESKTSKNGRELILQLLSEALHSFSLDVVKMVFNYLFFQNATVDAQVPTDRCVCVDFVDFSQPKSVLAFGGRGMADGQFGSNPCFGVAVSPDNKIWVASR